MNRMTENEFKDALRQAGLSFDLWGYEDILNLISEYFLDRSVTFSFDKETSNFLAERGRKIYGILKERGFYIDQQNKLHAQLSKRWVKKK